MVQAKWKNVGIFIPTLNAGSNVGRIFSAVKNSLVPTENIYVLDSESTDDTLNELEKLGISHNTVLRKDFSHGAVRANAVNFFGDEIDYIIMITQDVDFSAESINTLVMGIMDKKNVGVSYGRQISTNKETVEYYDRQFNYPLHSLLKTREMISQLGPNTYFSSDAFSVYRISALRDVGNFPVDVLFAEDVFVAAKLILKGWAVYYNANSVVTHNNISGYVSLFNRYRDIASFYSNQKWIKDAFGANYSKGKKLVKFELRQALKQRSVKLFIDIVITSAVKLIAYTLPERKSHSKS
ncbi:glycosyltransferase [Lacticaseibacillus paracasei]|uniref:glycosyltransferase n=1 Tax=Lacticaseibacillus paracasei TaxID=1597 RepID=UPI003896B08A